MNILIPHSWLLEYVDTDASPAEIAEHLSLSGPSVERIIDQHGEPVYDIEVTTNRVDMMSILGIAREVGVIIDGAQFNPPALPSIDSITPTTAELELPTIENNPKLNHRLTYIILTNIKRHETPKWMRRRLQEIDISIHDAAIDITNYVTHEFGHPCHAFDYDKVMAAGGQINVVEADPHESFTTLDGEVHKTVGGEVVFKNSQGNIIDLPSIKGTANTSIDESTSKILLLMESVVSEKVRFASMTHAIRTTAAQLMEKGVDPHLQDLVLAKATSLYQELCDAEIASQVFDLYPQEQLPQAITVTVTTIDQYLGIELELSKLEAILTDLGCKVTVVGENRSATLTVQPPTFRPDLIIPVDIVEEVARIYGYHNLPSVLMATRIPTKKPQHTSFNVEQQITHFLATLGWQELYTYSLVSQEIATASGYQAVDHLQLANPLTEDRIYLRRSLLPSLEEMIANNSPQTELSVFEIANVYLPQTKHKLPQEELRLGLVSTRPYRAVRGDLEALCQRLYIASLKVLPVDNPSTAMWQQQAQLVATSHQHDSIILGSLGILRSGKVGIEIKFSTLLEATNQHPAYKPLPKTMPIVEDITFTLPDSVSVGQVITTIEAVDKLIAAVTLKDIYQQNYTFTIEYLDPSHNLAVSDISEIRSTLVKTVEHEYKAQLVGEI